MLKVTDSGPGLGFFRKLAAALLLGAGLLSTPASFAGVPIAIERSRAPAEATASAIPVRHRIAVSVPDLAAMQPGASFNLSIPGHERELEIVFDHSETSPEGSTTWVGHLQGHGDLHRTIITTKDGHSVGRISTPRGNFHIESENGVTTLLDVERAGLKVPPFGEDAIKPLLQKRAAAHIAARAAARPGTAEATGSSVIDVMVLYNSSFDTRTGNGPNTIANLIAVANQAMSDSGVQLSFRLVRSQLMALSDQDSNSTLLYKITYPSDPSNSSLINDPTYAGLPALRDQYGADLVVAVRYFNNVIHVSCGVAWTLTELNTDSGIGDDAPYGYAVVSYGNQGGFVCDNVTMAHEMGHNMGSQHDRQHSLSSDGTLNEGAYSYSYGYGILGKFATIMAANYIQAPIIAKYSSPGLTCITTPLTACGISASDSLNSADNVQSLNNTRARVAQFKPTQVGTIVNITPATGYWWNPSEPGRGFNIEQRNGKLFMASFLYNAAGNTMWYGVGPGPINNAVYTGQLDQYQTGQTLFGSYKAPGGVVASGGNFSITFTSSTQGSITWPGGTIPITRFDFGPGGSAATPPVGTPQAGWWYAPTEGGRGFAVEIQGNSMFLAGYMYDNAGNPVWYASGPTPMNGMNYSGVWQQFANGQTLAGAYKPSSVINANVGAVTIQFTSTTTGLMTFPDGHQVQITRYAF